MPKHETIFVITMLVIHIADQPTKNISIESKQVKQIMSQVDGLRKKIANMKVYEAMLLKKHVKEMSLLEFAGIFMKKISCLHN